MAKTTQQSFAAAGKQIQLGRRNIGKTTPKDLRLVGEEVMTDCKASSPGHGVPVDTGMLRSTGMVEQPKPLEVELSFGGAAAPYALKQHEEMSYHHTVGEPRYLVRALERWKPGGSEAMKALKENAKHGLKKAGQGQGP